jgi:polar amino acid transport system ATP-binding protein
VIVEHGAPSQIFSAPENERTRLFLQRARGDDRRALRKRSRNSAALALATP